MSDQEIVAGAVAEWQQGHPIADGEARVIASQWHGGQASALYALASTGAITEDTLVEIDREIGDLPAGIAEAEGLPALLAYCERIGERGPVDGWARLWGRS